MTPHPYEEIVVHKYQWDWAPHNFLFSAFWSVIVFCNDLHLLQREFFPIKSYQYDSWIGPEQAWHQQTSQQGREKAQEASTLDKEQ